MRLSHIGGWGCAPAGDALSGWSTQCSGRHLGPRRPPGLGGVARTRIPNCCMSYLYVLYICTFPGGFWLNLFGSVHAIALLTQVVACYKYSRSFLGIYMFSIDILGSKFF